MTMGFITAKAAVQQILADYSATGQYRVLGYDDDANEADYLKGSNRLVQIYNKSGDFPKAGSGYVGSVSHDATMNIDLTTAANAKADLTVLDDPNASASEFATALAASQKATELADADLDDFLEIIYQQVMSAENIYFGLPQGTISNRWVARWNKGNPMMRGGSVIITATMDLTYRINEDLTGVTPKTATPDEAVSTEIKTTTDEDSEPQGGAGVLVGG